jgi:large subunit ribosomal protein L35
VPKIKTNQSARKRFKITSSGKVKRHRAYARHLLTKKTPKRKRHLRQPTLVNKTDKKRLVRLLVG